MKALLLVAVSLLVTGCAAKVKYINVPVPVTCQTPMPTAPAYPVVAPEDGLFVRTQKLLAREQLQDAYIKQLSAWGTGCHT